MPRKQTRITKLLLKRGTLLTLLSQQVLIQIHSFFFFNKKKETEMKDLKTTTQTYERIGKALGLSPAVLGRTQTNPTDKQMNLFLTNWELLDWVLKKSSLL